MGFLDATIRPIEEIHDRQGRDDFLGELATLQNLREYHKGKYTLIRCSGSRYEWSSRSRNVLQEALREAERINSKSDPFIAIEIKGDIVYHFDVQKIKDALLELLQCKQVELADAIASRYYCETHYCFNDKVEAWDFTIEQLNAVINKIKHYEIWKN